MCKTWPGHVSYYPHPEDGRPINRDAVNNKAKREELTQILDMEVRKIK